MARWRDGEMARWRDGEIYRHAVGERVGNADGCVVLLSATTVAAPGVSHARIARCGALGGVGSPPSCTDKCNQPAQTLVTGKRGDQRFTW